MPPTALKMVNLAHQCNTSNGKMKEAPLRVLKWGPPEFFSNCSNELVNWSILKRAMRGQNFN